MNKGMHHLTYSEMRTWKQCRQKHDYSYRQKLSALGVVSYFRLGGLVHRYIDLMYRSLTPEAPKMTFEELMGMLKEEWAIVCDQPNQFDDPDEKKTEIAVIEGMLRAYHMEFFLKEKFDGIVTEKEVTAEVGGGFFAGKIDGIVKRGEQLWIHEIKTASSFSETDRRLLTIDEQITHYCVIGEEKFGREFAGGIRTVLKKPGIKQTKKETLDEYCARVVADYQARPEFYLVRIDVPRLRWQLEQHRQYLAQIYAEMTDPHPNIFKSPSSSTCGMCDFFTVCTEPDPAIQTALLGSGFRVRGQVHAELETVSSTPKGQ